MRFLRPSVICLALVLALFLALILVAYAEELVPRVNSNLTGYRIDEDGIISEDGSYVRNIPGQWVHKNFQKNTNSCASCHMTHTGYNESLLFTQVNFDLCVACHDGTGSSFYDVIDNPVSAGRFSLGEDGRSGVSFHNSSGALQHLDAPGALPATEGDWERSFTCSSCHNPHGSFSSRMLQFTVNGQGENLVEMDISNQYGPGETVAYRNGVTELCLSCHTTFGTEGHPFTVETYTESFRHGMGMNIVGNNNIIPWAESALPLEVRGEEDSRLTCLTCHFAHGTDVSLMKERTADYLDEGTLQSLPAEMKIEENTFHLRYWSTDSSIGSREACYMCHEQLPQYPEPGVQGTTPAAFEYDINPNGDTIQVVFDVVLDDADLPDVTVKTEDDTQLTVSMVEAVGETLFITLDTTFVNGKTHTVRLENIKGKYGGIRAEYEFDFHTYITVEMYSPTGTVSASGVLIEAEFSHNVDAGSVNENTFRVTVGGNPVDGTIDVSGKRITFTPLGELDDGVTVDIMVDGVYSTSGAAIRDGTELFLTWQFETSS